MVAAAEEASAALEAVASEAAEQVEAGKKGIRLKAEG